MSAPKNMAKRAAAGTLALAVCLTGGAALAGSAQAATGFKFDARVGGADRFETAALASAKAFKTADTVVVVNYMATVDGLSASYVAGLHSAPILYTKANELPDVSAAEIDRLGAKNIIIVGGTGVVSADLKSSWESDGFSVTRYAGDNRYETAAKVAASGDAKPGKVFVANGNAPADALAVGPIAFAKHYPILLTKSDEVPTATSDELAALGTSSRVVAGGNAVVSDSTYADLKATKRLYGANRQGTAVEVSKWAIASEGFSNKDAALVGNTDANTADALVAAPLAGKNGVTLLFTQNGTVGTTTGDYLTSLSATLTGTGYVFGGTGAVSKTIADEATKAAAGTVVSSQGFIVTAVGNGSFSYADSASQAAKKVTFKSTDKYAVSGAAATQAAFIDNLKVGATVSIATSADGVSTYGLTPVTATTYSSGIVGSYDTTSGTNTLSVIEPITGTRLPFLSATATTYTYTTGGAFVNYTVDGQSVSQGIFEGAISLGDSISVTGTGADLTHIRTVALTSGSLSGTIISPTFSATAGQDGTLTGFSIKTTAGAVLGPIAVSAMTANDTFSIDGTSATKATFVGSGAVGSATASSVSVGDQVTYAKAGGVQKFALVNSAPSKLAGVVLNTITIGGTPTTTDSSGVAYWAPNGTLTKTLYSSVSRYVIDGTIASKTDFIAAVTAGDSVVYQPADATTNTVASLTLTSKPVSGTVTNALSGGGAHTVDVLDSDGDQIATGLDYSSTASYYSATGTPVYTVDGTTVTYAQFDAIVSRIQTGARQGSIQVSVNNATVTYALSTTVFSAAPAITGVKLASGGTSLVVTFNKPITNAAADKADWSISLNGAVAASPSAITAVSGTNTITMTVSATATTAAGQAIVVAPVSAAKAAGYLDTYGTALGASSFTGATS